jgi:uncharacterized protein
MVISPATVAAEDPPMSKYFVAFLHKGPKYDDPVPEAVRKERHERHVAFIKAQEAAGKMIAAGPFANAEDPRGMYILRVGSLAEAVALANQEPSVADGRIVMRVHPWFCLNSMCICVPPPAGKK